MDTSNMVHQANQIALFFRSYPEQEALAGVDDHLRKFWEPRLRRQLLAHAEAGGEGLDPLVMKALERMQ